MTGTFVGRIIVISTAVLIGAGCANQDKERISMLEDANRDLAERLNRTQQELATLGGNREELERQLQAVLAEADQLRRQLDERPSEPVAPGWTAVPGGAMIAIEGRVLFQPGRATLRPEARRTLDAIASTVMGQYADKDVLILGHTDDQPIKKSGWDDNFQLSAERALAVARYLRDRGVSTSRLIAAGCGEYRPKVANSSPSNRAANRRVEVYALTSMPRS